MNEHCKTLEEKLFHLREQEAITSDADQKFTLKRKIQDTELELSQAMQAGLVHGELGLEATDSSLLDSFFAECASHDPKFFQPHAFGEKESRRQFLISRALAFPSAKGAIALTDEGVLFCALRELIPSSRFHVHVQLQWGANQEHVWGSVLFLHRELLQRLEQLSSRVMGNPELRNNFGSEIAISEYPQLAIFEALTNFLIHRD